MSAAASAYLAPPPEPDSDLIERFYRALSAEGDVRELRVPSPRQRGKLRHFGVASGYFDDGETFARCAGRFTGDDAEAVYVTLNPVVPDLLARAWNRVEGGRLSTTSDAQVLRLSHLLVDIDPAYEAGISRVSATDRERAAALSRRDDVRAFLCHDLGWPAPVVVGASGNGGSLIFRLDLINELWAVELLRRGLQALAGLFDDDEAKIDTTTYNPARITKVLGTVAAKGDHFPGRPWRLATGVIDEAAGVLARDQLDALAQLFVEESPALGGRSAREAPGGGRSWDIREVLRDSGVGFAEKARGDVAIFALNRCLTSDDHADGACVIERPDGMLLYRCHHDRCRGRTWHDAKQRLRLPGRSRFTSPPPPGAGTSHDSRPGASGGFPHAPNGMAGDDWPTRGPLPVERPPVPTLPPEMVPAPLRDWVVDIADRSRLPLEMVAVPAIVAVGAVVGRTVGIRPGRFDDFTVVANLWGALVARPGWMKSGAVKEAFRPVGRLAAAAHAAHEAAAVSAAARRERIEAELDALKGKMREAARKGGALGELEEKVRSKRQELREAAVTERRYLTHDATVEKLGELLRDNPRGMLLLRDELSGWLRALDKPGREGDREFFLEAWNGTGSFTTDRIGRGTVHIPALTVSVFGGVQPGKLRPLLAAAAEGGAGDDGLVQRLQLTVWPDRLEPWRKPDRWPDQVARDRADAAFGALDGLTPATVGAQPDDDVPYLRFSPAAQAIHDAWRDELEGRLRSEELDDSPAFAAHLSKYRSLMPALALVFHLVDAGATEGAVGEHAARLGAAWCEYLECHARKLYAVELNAGASAARAVAAKIEAGAVIDGQAVRELYRAQWSGLRTPERVLLGLTTLGEVGWLRLETALTGGRPSQIVRLHPELRGEGADG